MKPELNPRVQAALFHEALVLWRPSHPQHKEKSSLVPRPSSRRLGLAGLLPGTSPGQLPFSCPTLGKKKVGFGHRASRLCVTAQLGHLSDKNRKPHSRLGNERTEAWAKGLFLVACGLGEGP